MEAQRTIGTPTAAWRERLKAATSTGMPGTREERIIFWCLLALAAVLRGWNLPHLPFMHDEISALVRLYPTWGETLSRGVIEVDTHPPGVQLFEWLWTRAFGSEEWIVKLPFILFSLAALFHLYRIACAWTNATVALIATALMATLQYFVLYGQIARPYALGLFTTAAAADFLTRWIARDRRRDLVLFTLMAALSAYSHHFALLQAALIVGIGWAMITTAQRKPFLIACGVALLCYLPNVPILLHQLELGGLGEWLRAPDRWWLLAYAWWIVHCSGVMLVALLALLAWSLMLRVQRGGHDGPFARTMLLWGLAPLVIGFCYSILRAPVLQYSVLIFSFPYLLLLALSGIQRMSWERSAIICSLTAMAAVFSLINDRRHFTMVYRSKYEGMIRDGMRAQERYGKNDLVVLLDAPEHVIRFYMDRWMISDADFPYVQLRDRLTPGGIDSTLIARGAGHVFFGMSNGARPETPARIQALYPFLLERSDLAEGQCLLFGLRAETSDALPQGSVMDRVAIGPYDAWSKHLRKVLAAGTSEAFLEHTGSEFGVEFNAHRDTLLFDDHDHIEVWATVLAEAATDAALVIELKDGDSTVFYRGSDIAPCRAYGQPLTTLVVSASAAEIGPDVRFDRFKTYLWDRDRSELYVHGLCAYLREGNPVQFALYEPIRGDWRFR